MKGEIDYTKMRDYSTIVLTVYLPYKILKRLRTWLLMKRIQRSIKKQDMINVFLEHGVSGMIK